MSEFEAAQAGDTVSEAWPGKRGATLGWRPHFRWSIIANWLARRGDMELIARRKLAPFGLFTLIRLRRAV